MFETVKLSVLVLRRLLKTGLGFGPSPKPGIGSSESLLGYQGGCLSAPAEVSSWTRFCEIDLPETTSKFLARKIEAKEVEIDLPVDFARSVLIFFFCSFANYKMTFSTSVDGSIQFNFLVKQLILLDM